MKLPPLLLLSGSVLLLLACAGILLLVRLNTGTGATMRVRAVLGPYRPAGTTHRDLAESLRERLPRLNPHLPLGYLFGIDMRRSAEYPVRWPLVLAGALAVAMAAGWLITLLVDMPPWMPVPVLWIVLCRSVFGFFARLRRDLLFRQFPDVLAMIVRALRVGQTVTEALRGAAYSAPQPSAAAFNRLADRLAIGVPLTEALPEMADDSSLTEYRFFCTALLLQSQTGGSLTEALDTLAEVIRNRVTLQRRAYAMSGEARTSAVVLAVLPVITFAAMMLVVPEYAGLLLQDPVGRRILGAAIGMLIVGAVIMNAMVRRLLR